MSGLPYFYSNTWTNCLFAEFGVLGRKGNLGCVHLWNDFIRQWINILMMYVHEVTSTRLELWEYSSDYALAR